MVIDKDHSIDQTLRLFLNVRIYPCLMTIYALESSN